LFFKLNLFGVRYVTEVSTNLYYDYIIDPMRGGNTMLTGVILAGGKNDEIKDRKKSLIPIGNSILLMVQIQEMRKVCNEIILVTNEPRKFLPYLPTDVRIITDYYKDIGPLAGIHAALNLSKNENIWVVGSGMPFISFKVALIMMEHSNNTTNLAVIPTKNLQPYLLHSIWNKNALPLVEYTIEELNGDYTKLVCDQHIYPIYEATLIKDYKMDTSFLYTIDTTGDYKKAMDILLQRNLNFISS
jgi:molybdenum cofactor guanylyltransferase